MIDVRKQAEIRVNPLKDPARINVVLERETVSRLKLAAVEMDTTTNEIVRALVDQFLDDWNRRFEDRTVFVIHYGIKEFNSDGSEKSGGVDSTSGAFYTDIDKALENQRFWFDGMVNEMKSHHPRTRKSQMAYSYIEAVSGITEDGYDGDPVEWSKLSEEIQNKLNSANLECRGSDV